MIGPRHVWFISSLPRDDNFQLIFFLDEEPQDPPQQCTLLCSDTTGRGGLTDLDFGYGCAAAFIYYFLIGGVKEHTHSYTGTSHSENCTHSHILFFKFYPFIYFFGEKDTPLIYFWSENDTQSYTWRPEKYTPFHPHICIYL